MRARFVATLPLIVAACGDNDRAPDEPASGARLALVRYVYPDGTTEVDAARFYDRLRDEPCAPATWSDGSRYCTPDAAEAIYTTETCDTEVARVPAGATPRYALHRFAIRGEQLPSKLHPLGAAVAAPAQHWQLRDGICDGPFDETGGCGRFPLRPGGDGGRPAARRRRAPRRWGRPPARRAPPRH